MTRLLVSSLPMIAACVAAVPFSCSRGFDKGLIAGSLVHGACGALQVWVSRDFIMAGSEWKTLGENTMFSTISVSFIFNFSIIGAAVVLETRRRFTFEIMLATVIAVCLYCIFLLSQRMSLILALICALVLVHRRTGRGTFGYVASVAVCIGMGLGISSFFQSSFRNESSLTHQFERFGALFEGEDQSSLSRMGMWSFCFGGMSENFIGHGVGSFRECYGEDMESPHNVLAESAFELGLAGFIFAGLLSAMSAYCIWKMCRIPAVRLSMDESSGDATAYMLKAGDMSTIRRLGALDHVKRGRRSKSRHGIRIERAGVAWLESFT